MKNEPQVFEALLSPVNVQNMVKCHMHEFGSLVYPCHNAFPLFYQVLTGSSSSNAAGIVCSLCALG